MPSFLTSIQNSLKRKVKALPLPYMIGDAKDCIGCEAPCMSVCETDIIVRSEDGGVALSFKEQGCTYCEECAKACIKEVLSLNSPSPQINATIFIDEAACIAHHGVMCMSCKDPCLEDAIVFNGLFSPEIIQGKCTSCGFCYPRCPADAIRVVA